MSQTKLSFEPRSLWISRFYLPKTAVMKAGDNFGRLYFFWKQCAAEKNLNVESLMNENSKIRAGVKSETKFVIKVFKIFSSVVNSIFLLSFPFFHEIVFNKFLMTSGCGFSLGFKMFFKKRFFASKVHKFTDFKYFLSFL